MKKLTALEVEKYLKTLPEWQIEDSKLTRKFQFMDFPTAFGFMTSVAIICQAMNHHPEWLNVYTTVTVWLSSHEIDGLSQNDIELARHMDRLAKN